MKKVFMMIVCIMCFSISATLCEEKAVYKDPGAPVKERIKYLMARMTLEEKIGQMVQVDKDFLIEFSDISKYSIGSILSGGDSMPKDITAKGWADFYDKCQKEALKNRLSAWRKYVASALTIFIRRK